MKQININHNPHFFQVTSRWRITLWSNQLFTICFLSLLGIFLGSCEKEDFRLTEENILTESILDLRSDEAPCVTDLIAGQHTVVGQITVEEDGETVTVTYEITDPAWFITETHLYLGSEAPKKSAPGRFPYKHEDLDFQSDSYTVALSEIGVIPGECVHVAAHAVVQKVIGYEPPSLTEFSDALPSQVDMMVNSPGAGSGDPSYFDVMISGGTSLDGVYDDWCIDTDRTIASGELYTANVYSSYETLPDGMLEKPENLDLVNWIINQDFVGQASPSCDGTYTYGDIQRAIWTLIDDEVSTAGLGDWSQCRTDEILAAAAANGEGFEPGCGDVIAVILQPVNEEQITIAQVTFGEIVVPCTPIYQSETAWGFGEEQFRQGWGWHFTCCTQPEEPV